MKHVEQSRSRLTAMIGQEGYFFATVYRTGTREGARIYTKEVTFVLHNIRDDRRRLLADHVWVPVCQALIDAQIRQGDCIEFHAKVVSYVTGYRRGEIPSCSATFAEIRDVMKIMQKGLYY